MPKIRVLLIEDNRLLREGIAAMLKGHGDFKVITRSGNGDAVRQLRSVPHPDVVLLDLGLEREDSLGLVTVLGEQFPEAKVITIDILPEHTDIVKFVKAGGCGFVLKDACLDDYIKTIKDVVGGAKVLPPIMTKSLFTQIVELALESGKGIPNNSIQLTNRERQIVDLISEGLSNKEIAERLYIATHTVKSHVHNILEKLTLSTRLQIAAFARRDESK